MFVDPTPIKVTGDHITTGKVNATLNTKSASVLIVAFRKCLLSHPWRKLDKPNSRPAIRGVIKEIRNPSSDNDLKIRILKTVLFLGGIRSFVVEGITAYALLPDAWSPIVSRRINQYEWLINGIFCLDPNMVMTGSPDQNLINKPVFVSNSDLKKFLNIRPQALGTVRKIGNLLVENYRRKFPDHPMRKEDFVNLLLERCPDLSKKRAEETWAEV